MISEDIAEDISVAIKEIMKIEDVSDYKYDIEGKSECGDNYMGVVIFVKVETKENGRKPYNLVVKTAKRSEELRQKFPVGLFYDRELFMYTGVFPNFRKLLQEKPTNLKFDFVPHMYWVDKTTGKETVVLENLKTKDFKLYDRKKPWNLEHSVFTMKHYGKFHALSIALKEQKPEVFNELKQNLGVIGLSFIEKIDFKKFYQDSFTHVLNLLEKNGRSDLVDKCKVLFDELDGIFTGKTEDGDRLAICHMDCWNNNFMFKYEGEDESSPCDIRFLDFQLSVFDSPAKDISYNIYATCDNTCLKHFDELLQIYLETVRDSLKSLGCDPEKCMSIEELRRHWRKYGIYGLFLSINLIKMELLNKDDAPSLEEMVKDDNLMDGFNVKVSNQEEYDRRILEVFLHFGDNFL